MGNFFEERLVRAYLEIDEQQNESFIFPLALPVISIAMKDKNANLQGELEGWYRVRSVLLLPQIQSNIFGVRGHPFMTSTLRGEGGWANTRR